ncbi:MAG: DNA-methyltransferase, partial [Thermoplasmata archaeon]
LPARLADPPPEESAPPRPRGRLGADTIIHGDAAATLAALPAESIHLAMTSPPYNVGIPYRGYEDDREHDAYLDWLRRVWLALYRVLVPGGRFALNVAPTSIKEFHPIHHDLSRDLRAMGFIMRTEIIWYKQTMGRRTAWGSWRSPSNPHIIPSWEYVLVFSKGQWNLPGRKDAIDLSSEEFQRISDGFWSIKPERHRRGHPAPFPEALVERVVKYYSYRGNVVLDMFGGSGTVASVSRANGRHYVSVDSSAEYCADARARVAGAVPPPEWPIPAPEVVTEGPVGPRPAAPGRRGSVRPPGEIHRRRAVEARP